MKGGSWRNNTLQDGSQAGVQMHHLTNGWAVNLMGRI